ncbi:ATP-dependent DNA ligase [Candidatus Nitrosotalea okcheonensis]|uniref:DNA ligase n=1 Tax=Candidatus Nitrosotalea okcheonensis TaxID=1903276 RepID=A0A2H1FE28_9ARCH|nr:ATP-dependent DNA ligase [Candidatus Nitrosotalea okcheonensis]SMH71036.1 DNA ligase [Candidatus Nitrosotalea okcheonensis]
MKFSLIADTLGYMENTTKRLELTQHLVDLFKITPSDIISKVIYLLQGKLRPDHEGVEIGIAEKIAIKALSKSSGISVKKIEDEYRDTGDFGQVASKILEQKTQTTFLSQNITVERVYDTLYKIAELKGARSQDMKMKYISSLLNDATPIEGGFIAKIITSNLRLGIADYTILDALAVAYTGSKENRPALEHAYNVCSDLGKVAKSVAENGLESLKDFQVTIFSPIRPMLAERVKSPQEAREKMGTEFVSEYKLDGERVQIHRQEEKIVLYSRSLENITNYYPDIVENIGKVLKPDEVILEAEVVAMNDDTGEFLPFQELMHRRRKYKIAQAVQEYPITVNFFDVLSMDKKSCLDLPYVQRRKLLEKNVIEDSFAKIMPMVFVKTDSEVEDSLENAINAGCEGIMLKQLNSPYRAGARASNWLKLKREYRNELGDSIDLVIVGAFYGRGRRTGRYGALLLSAYDDKSDTFPSICKVGTGFTDDSLDQFYQILSDKITIRKDPRIESGLEADVWFEPEVVIEIVASEITLSPIHKVAMDKIRKGSGLALRFPKFTGKIRFEKTSENATNIDEIVTLYNSQKRVVQDEK